MRSEAAKQTAREARSPIEVEIVAAVIAAAVTPWAASKLWEWFVVPLGVPAIGYWHGMGFVMIVWFGKAICAKSPVSWAIGVAIVLSGGFFAMLNMR